jgi:hypothetical protein
MAPRTTAAPESANALATPSRASNANASNTKAPWHTHKFRCQIPASYSGRRLLVLIDVPALVRQDPQICARGEIKSVAECEPRRFGCQYAGLESGLAQLWIFGLRNAQGAQNTHSFWMGDANPARNR